MQDGEPSVSDYLQAIADTALEAKANPDALEGLRSLTKIEALTELALAAQVQAARQQGHGWIKIGAAVGMRYQSAQTRWGYLDEPGAEPRQQQRAVKRARDLGLGL